MPSKVFNDPVHGHIELHELCVKVIDTPQFQRLRDVLQLGGVSYVFTGASASRFEHSLGVCHLAGVFLECLRRNSFSEGTTHCASVAFTKQDALCVQLAGLCHDLGHGILSHWFDMKFIPAIHPNTTWTHEHASVAMLEHLIKANDLWPSFDAWGLSAADVHFIQELIIGARSKAPIGWNWVGRGQKTYLYDIVANASSGIDVDKFDYFSRDCMFLGISKSFDALRLMRFSQVHEVEGCLRVCFRDKEAWNCYELFHTRFMLHRRAYQHRVSTVIELMLCEAMVKADPHIKLMGKDGQQLQLSESIHDMVAYGRCSDYLLRVVENSSDPELGEARAILHRIRVRDLYRFVGEVPGGLLSKEEVLDGLMAELQFLGSSLPKADMLSAKAVVNYGQGSGNPVEKVIFYNPRAMKKQDSISHAGSASEAVGMKRKEDVSGVLPHQFEERWIRVWCRSNGKNTLLSEAWHRFCSKKQLTQELSPVKNSLGKRSRGD